MALGADPVPGATIATVPSLCGTKIVRDQSSSPARAGGGMMAGLPHLGGRHRRHRRQPVGGRESKLNVPPPSLWAFMAAMQTIIRKFRPLGN